MEPLEDRYLSSTYTVTTSKDVLGDVTLGEVTLRDVLTAINTQAPSGNAPAGTATNTVRFAIGAPGSVQTVRVGSGNVAGPLPALARRAFVDGWSQGGAGYGGPPLIVLNGAGAGNAADGLELDAGSSGSTVRGLVIQQFSNNGIELKGAGNVISGNYIGTDAAGTSVLGNGNDGVLVSGGAKNNTIGGATAGAGNVICGGLSGHAGAGIAIDGTGTSRNVVLGNLIGTNASGTAKLGHLGNGILIEGGATTNTVGGIPAGSGNTLGGSDAGIDISGAGTSGNVIQGNHIGTDTHATLNLGNTLAGVFVENGATSNTIGGNLPGSGNVSAYNGCGVIVGNSPADIGTVHDSVLGNNIFANAGPAIELGNQGPTPNGVNPRPYPNDGQNTPTINALTLHSISGGLTSIPNTTFRIETFANPVGAAAKQGQAFLGFLNVTTDAAGKVNFTLPVTLPLGAVVTATATNLTNGDTSESSLVGTQLVLLPTPVVVSGNVAQTVSLSAQVLTGTNPVSSGQVQFGIVGLPGQVTGTPNSNGVATVGFTMPAGVAAGQYPVIATFLGSEEIAPATGTGLLTVNSPAVPKVGRRWSR